MFRFSDMYKYHFTNARDESCDRMGAGSPGPRERMRRMGRKLTAERPVPRTLLALVALALAGVLLALWSGPADAATTFIVNSTADHADAILGVDGCDTGYTVTGADGQQVPECTLSRATR